MEPVPEIDCSEIISQADESWAFVDSNIFETARQELERNKFTQVIEWHKTAINNHIKEINGELILNNKELS